MKYLNIKKALAAWQELQPLSEKDKDRLSRRFTVDFNYNSNHIEGNTLTYPLSHVACSTSSAVMPLIWAIFSATRWT